MPSFRVRWFVVLLGVFLSSLGADYYLGRSPVAGSSPATNRVNAADFLQSAAAGDLSAGRTPYRINTSGLADLSATRTRDGHAETITSTARLTEPDLTLLRQHNFLEDDAA